MIIYLDLCKLINIGLKKNCHVHLKIWTRQSYFSCSKISKRNYHNALCSPQTPMMATEDQTVGKCVAFSCPICLEQIMKPKCLPCSHTFCEKCLQIYITRDAIGKENCSFEFKCPVCRRLTGSPETEIPV